MHEPEQKEHDITGLYLLKQLQILHGTYAAIT